MDNGGWRDNAAYSSRLILAEAWRWASVLRVMRLFHVNSMEEG